MLRLSRTLVRLPKPTHILTRRSLTTTVAQKVFFFLIDTFVKQTFSDIAWADHCK